MERNAMISIEGKHLAPIEHKILSILCDGADCSAEIESLRVLVGSGLTLAREALEQRCYDYHDESFARKLLATRAQLSEQLTHILTQHTALNQWYDSMVSRGIHPCLIKRIEQEIFEDFALISFDEHSKCIQDPFLIQDTAKSMKTILAGHKRMYGNFDLIERIEFRQQILAGISQADLHILLGELMGVRMIGFCKSGLEEISDESIAEIKSLFERNQIANLLFSATSLDALFSSRFDDVWSSCHTLRGLGFSLNDVSQLSPESLRRFMTNFPNLNLLQLGYNSLYQVSTEGLSALFSSPRLASVSLYDVNLGNYECSQLASIGHNLKSIYHLDIGNNFDESISLEKLHALFSPLHKLRSLSCCSNALNAYAPDKLEVVFGHPQITTLDLSYNPLGEMTLEQLKAIFHRPTQLHTLNLEGTNICDLETNTLQELFAHLTGLKQLTLSNNSLGNTSMKALEMIFSPLEGLKILIIPDNGFFHYEKERWDLILSSLGANGRVILQSHDHDLTEILPNLKSDFPHLHFDNEQGNLLDFWL